MTAFAGSGAANPGGVAIGGGYQAYTPLDRPRSGITLRAEEFVRHMAQSCVHEAAGLEDGPAKRAAIRANLIEAATALREAADTLMNQVRLETVSHGW